jgi:5-methylcytosine-specific restriction endonuclease McrA
MCQRPIPVDLKGKTEGRHAVLDHVRPWRLRPDLSLAPANLQLICRDCHAKCETIEAAHWPNTDMIAEAKARASERWA